MNIALLLLLAAAPAPQSWQFGTSATPQVSVSNINGSIRVEATDDKRVSVEATREGAGDARIEVKQEKDSVSVRLCCGPCEGHSNHCNDPAPVHFVVKTPRDARLEVASVNASVKVAGVRGALEVASVAGGVDVKGSRGALEVSSVSGAIDLAPEALEKTEIHSVSGDVKLKLPRGTGAHVEFSSVGGSFNGRGVSLGSTEQRYGTGEHEVEVNTVSGAFNVVSDDAAK